MKCIYIDPPYNTGSAFTHYDDGIEHSLWLTMMRDRLEILRRLLREDGSIWITVDDSESHYLKVLCDEIFGRDNFVSNVVWQKKYTVANDAKWLSDSHDHILVFATSKEIERIDYPWPFSRSAEDDKHAVPQDSRQSPAYRRSHLATSTMDHTRSADTWVRAREGILV